MKLTPYLFIISGAIMINSYAVNLSYDQCHGWDSGQMEHAGFGPDWEPMEEVFFDAVDVLPFNIDIERGATASSNHSWLGRAGKYIKEHSFIKKFGLNSAVTRGLFGLNFELIRGYRAPLEVNVMGGWTNARGLFGYADGLETTNVGAVADIRGLSTSAHAIGNYNYGALVSGRLANVNFSVFNIGPTGISATARGLNINVSLFDISPTLASYSLNAANVDLALFRFSPVYYSEGVSGFNFTRTYYDAVSEWFK